MTTNPTPVMRLSRPTFNASTWHDDVNNNMTILDGALASIGIISNIKGVWANNTFYDVEDRVASTTGLGLWANEVAHTSPATGSFIDYLTANPGSWRPVTGGIVPRGEWATASEYKLNDLCFVEAQGLALICVFDHTSGVLDDDITSGYWFLAIDFSSLALTVDDLEDAVETTTINAATATTQAGIATTQAGIATAAVASIGTAVDDAEAAAAAAAADAATVAGAVSAAQTAETNAETAETNAETAAALAAGYAATLATLNAVTYHWTATAAQTTFLGAAATPPITANLPGKDYCFINFNGRLLLKDEFTVSGMDILIAFADAEAGEEVDITVHSVNPVNTPGAGSITTPVLDNDAVTNTKLANMVQATLKGRAAGTGTGDPVDLTSAQVLEVLDLTSAAAGINLFLHGKMGGL